MHRASENLFTLPICCVLPNRMGVVSSKRQVKEKGKDGWSPVKASTYSKEPPPLPPLVSDYCVQLEGRRRGGTEHLPGSHSCRLPPPGASAISRLRALTNRPPPNLCCGGRIGQCLAARLPSLNLSAVCFQVGR